MSAGEVLLEVLEQPEAERSAALERLCGADDALRAEKDGADYIGVSPVFATPTKTDTAPALGLSGLRAIRKAVDIPLVGIGGLKRDNAASVIAGGADGVAVVSEIVSADDPQSAARQLRDEIDRGKKHGHS